MPNPVRIQPATPADIPFILQLIRELADYEHEPDAVLTTEAMLQEALFGPKPAAEAAVARYGDEPAAFALWFQTFSTWLGRPGLWLEDLYVRPHLRRRGIGRTLLVHIATLAQERGYGRVEWSALDWNQPAIDFYRTADATRMEEWTIYRLTGDALARLAAIQQ
jgi:GNAT superfamily N-acetyltransferase